MITYKNCSDVDIDLIYEGFQTGFSDYIIKINMSKEAFIKHFFGPEGNELEYSYIALDRDKPVGLILGGIKTYEGIKTLRCGALCVHPSDRGKGISQKLFEYHKQVGIKNNCKQLFLEVIVGNNRAINFYKKLGYDKIYDLSYFTLKDVSQLKEMTINSFEIRQISLKEIKTLGNYIYDIHINWQNDFDYIEKLNNEYQYGIYKDESFIAALSINQTGSIHFLWVSPRYRNQRIASHLISYAASKLHLSKLSICGTMNRVRYSLCRIIPFEYFIDCF